MLEIAGGILIAVAVLAALPYIVVMGYWAIVIGIGLIVFAVTGHWLVDAVGQGWAMTIALSAFVGIVGWVDFQKTEEPFPRYFTRAVATVMIGLLKVSAIIVTGLAAIVTLMIVGLGIIAVFRWAFGEIGESVGLCLWVAACIGLVVTFSKWNERRKTRQPATTASGCPAIRALIQASARSRLR